jgi:hypothetical protein
MPRKTRDKRPAKSVLRLPDLDHSRPQFCKAWVQRTYAYAINDFITWY